MNKKLLRVGLTLTLTLGIGGCFTNTKSRLLESRVEYLFESWKQGKYENIHEMLLPSMQKNISRERYAGNLQRLYGKVNIEYSKPKIIAVAEKYAIATSNVVMKPKEQHLTFNNCMKILLVWGKNNWYYLNTASCESDFEEEINRIMKAKDIY